MTGAEAKAIAKPGQTWLYKGMPYPTDGLSFCFHKEDMYQLVKDVEPPKTELAKQRTVCVFAGAGGSPKLVREGFVTGYELAKAGLKVIYGGSSKGVMGGLARGVQAANGTIVGVLPAKIAQLKHYDPGITIVETEDMQDRKAYMFNNSDAYLCLPGSYGSLDELFEVLTLSKLGYAEKKPIVILNSDGFYDGLEMQLDAMMQENTLSKSRRELVSFKRDLEDAVAALS